MEENKKEEFKKAKTVKKVYRLSLNDTLRQMKVREEWAMTCEELGATFANLNSKVFRINKHSVEHGGGEVFSLVSVNYNTAFILRRLGEGVWKDEKEKSEMMEKEVKL